MVSPCARSSWIRIAVAIALSLAGPGCAVEWTREHKLYCRTDETLGVRETLYFGRSIPGGGMVDDASWKRFEDDAIANAFPTGFTVLEARGAWRGADGVTISEPSRVIAIVHADDAASDAAIREIVKRYRSDFHQEAVLRERAAVCISF